MAGPWDQYAPSTTTVTPAAPAGASDGPWTQYAAPSVPAPATTPTLQNPNANTGDFMRGLKTAAHQLPQLAGGAVAFGGDVASRAGKALGGDGSVGDAITNYGLDLYKRHENDTQQLSKPSDSFTHVLKNPRDLGSYLKYNAGYMGGQLLESAAVMGAGALAGSEVPGAGNVAGAAAGLVARPMVERMVLKKAAELVSEKGMAKEAAAAAARAAVNKRLGAEAGAAIAGGALNTGQELGSIYPDARDQAQSEGRTLTGTDLARVGGSAVAAGAVDTLADRLNLGAAARGVRVVEDAGKSTLRRRAEAAGKEMLKQGAIGGGTELAQTGFERYGAGQPMTGTEALQDYVDSSASGVVGGGMTGAGAGLHVQRPASVPNPGAAPGTLSDAANVLQRPAAGPVGRAAQEAVLSGATAAAQAGQAAADQAVPAPAPAPAAPVAETPTPNPAPAPGIPPWVDPTTGELGAPTKGQLTTALADHILQTYQQTGHMRFDAQTVADAWGVTKKSLNQVRQAAIKNATARVAAAERAAMNPSAATPQDGQVDQQDQPAAPAAAPSEPNNTASIPFMITQAMKADLRAAGFADSDIAKMTPAQANEALRATTDQPATGASTNERATEPAPAAPAGTGAEVAGAADAQPAANGDAAGSAAAAEPVANGATAVAGDGTPTDAGDTLTPNATTQENADATAQPGTLPAGSDAAAGDGGTAAAGGGVEQGVAGSARGEAQGVAGQAPAQEAAAPRARVPAAAAAEPAPAAVAPAEPKAPRAARASGGSAGGATGGSSPAAAAAKVATPTTGAVTRIEAVGAHGLRLHGDPAAIRTQLAAGGFKKKGELKNGALRFDAKDRPRIEAALAQPTGKEALQIPPSTTATTTFKPSQAASKAESLRVKTPDGEVNGRTHVDQLVKRGFTQLASQRAGDKMVHTLSNAAGESQPIHARQLDYAREVTGNAAAPVVNDSLTTASAQPTAENSSIVAPDKRATSKAAPKRGGITTSGAKARITGGKLEYVPRARETLEAYFKPGDVVPSYGGQDKVISTDFSREGDPRVRVIAVDKNGDPLPNERERVHGTMPAARELVRKLGKPVLAEKPAAKENVTTASDKATPAPTETPTETPPQGGVSDSLASKVEAAASEAAAHPDNGKPEPTPAQKEAGNYEMGHVSVQGLDISIENPRGSTRSGVGEDGKPWSHVMTAHYGYIRRTEGADGEQVDVYLGPHPESERVYVVDQIDQRTGGFDEHKALLGFDSEAAAVAAYKGNFDKGWKVGPVTAMSMDEFRAWLKEGDTTKPLKPVDEAAKAAPQAAAADQSAANTKDAGEELWANRRNSTGKGLSWTDIADLNDTLKAREAVKSKVWPRPNYGELVEGGMPAPIAHVIKQMYDALATKPQTRGAPTDAQYQDYIAAVQRMRDAAFDWARQVMEATGGMDDKAAASARETASKGGIDPAQAAAITSALRLAQARNYPVLDAVFPMPKKEDFREPSRFRTGEQGKANNALGLLLGGNKFANALQVGERSLRAAFKAVDGGWPAAKSGWEISFTIHEAAGAKPEFFVVRKGTRRVVADGFATRSEAEAAAQTAYARMRKSGGDGAKAEAPVELRDARSGPVRRLANEDVTSDQLRETFGFKGINFGNWMKGSGAKNEAERQAHLNHAYDAFHDLAEIMGLPAKAMSLNGTLGLAFGAQGNGGKRAAAAHFIPGVNEINLTREQGAGSLAHEWAHALDHYFAVQAGGLAASEHPFLTEQVTRAGAGIRPEVRTAFLNIVQAMTTREQTAQELAEQLNRYQKRGRDGVEEVLRTARQAMERNGKGDMTAALAQFDELAKRLRVGDVGEGYVKTGKGRMDSAPQVVAQVANLVKETTGRKPDWTQALASYARMVSGAVAAKRDNAERAARVPSDFAREARKLEGTRQTPYWSTKLEMFARAFQSYVLDKLAAEGNRNHYLTRQQMSGEDFARLKADPEMAPLMEAGDRYPRGAEREAINKAFDTLVGELKTRTGEDGRVALFRRGPEVTVATTTASAADDAAVTPAQEAHRARIEQIATAAKSVWKGDDVPDVIVVATPEQLPPFAKRAANGLPSTAYKAAAGMYDGRRVWIVASKHATDAAGLRKLLTTMAHEGVGHYGIDRIVTRELGHQAWTKIAAATERLRANPKLTSPSIQKVLESTESRYSGADAELFAKEFLAVSAEMGVRNSLLDRAITAMRQFVRRMGEALQNHPALRGMADRMANLRLSEHELRQLLVKSDQYLRVGETQQQRVQSRAALAFSKSQRSAFNDAATFAQAVADFEAGKLPADKSVRVTEGTPDVLRKLGAPDLPIEMSTREMAKVLRGPEINGGKHGLGKAVLQQLVRQLHEPVAVFDSYTMEGVRRPDHQVILTELRDAGGQPVMAAIQMNRHGEAYRINSIRSVYGRPMQQYVNWVQQGRLRYIDQSKTPDWLATGELQLLKAANPSRASGRKVLTDADIVKPFTTGTGQYSLEAQTDTPAFREFFGDSKDGSKVLDAAGNPLPVYHGTADEFDTFDPQRSGSATAHMTANLGTFFAEDRAKAQHYAENASGGVPAEERVVDAFLNIRKPYTMSLKEFMSLDSQEQSQALRDRLMKEGFDGIHIPEVKQWVAFHANQIKSASENRGTFDRSTGNIYFSRETNDRGEHDAAGEPPAPFSHAAESTKNLDEAVSTSQETTFQKVKDWMRGKYEDLVPAMLGAVQRRFLTELMAGHPALRMAKQYDEDVQALNATRQQLLAGAPDASEHPDNMLKHGAAAIADDLRSYAHVKGPAGWLGAKTEAGRTLAGVMHDSTILGIDPSEAYEPLKMKDSRGEWVTWTPALVKERIATLKEVMRGRPGDDKRQMMDEIKMLRNLKFRERDRTKAYPELVARYEALPAKGKKLFQQVRDWHAQYSVALQDALEARVEALRGDLQQGDPELAVKHLRMLTQKLRAEFEEARVQGVYFPLNRDGDFFVSYTDKAGGQGFQMFESAAAQERFVKDTRRAGGAVVAQGRRGDAAQAKDAPPGTLIADVVGTLKKAGAPEKVQDDIYQLFLRMLPEMSMRKHAIHRKATPGFSDDITRGFAKTAFHGAHQLARLQYTHRLQGTIDTMQKAMDVYRRKPDAGSLEVSRGDALLAELKRRHQYLMSPTDSQLANVANSIGFLWFLGASPASALVNLTQNAQVTLPVLGAHHGWPKAMKELGRAVRDSVKTGGNIHRTLTDPDELRAYNMLRARGDIDKTRAHDLAGLSEGNLIQTNPVWAKVMAGMTWLFHKAEVVNREAAGMAAYRLARQRGDDFTQAVQYASDIINGTHFDYSADNRPPFMQGNTARIAFQFKNYSVSMTQLLYRNLYQAFKGETPEVRRMARRTLTGVLGMTGLLAGAVGLPIINVMRFAAAAAHAAFGDDDEPWDFDTEFRAWLAEHFGDTAAGWIADGAVSHVTGANIANRVSLSDMWFRDADQDLEGKDQYYAYMDSLLGPLAGAAKNMFIGSKMIGDGHTLRGIETMLPSFAKNAMKGYRYASQGVNSLAGAPIVSDVSGLEAFSQMIGLQPTSVAEQQRINSAAKNYGEFVSQRRTSLRNAYAMAVEQGDGAARAATQQRIVAFNQRWPLAAIKPGDIRASLKGRARARTEENGINLPRKLRGTLMEMVNPTGQ